MEDLKTIDGEVLPPPKLTRRSRFESVLLQPPSPIIRSRSNDIADILVDLSKRESIIAAPIERDEQTWGVCCSRTEKSFIKFIVQVTMGILVMLFCMGMIALGDGTHDMIAFTLISGTLGLFFPHPSMSKEDD